LDHPGICPPYTAKTVVDFFPVPLGELSGEEARVLYTKFEVLTPWREEEEEILFCITNKHNKTESIINQ